MALKRSSVKLNVIYQMFYEFLALCLPLITSPYISRILGAEQVGIYSYTYSIAVYFGMVCTLGVKNHGNRSIAKCRDNQDEINRTFSNIYALQFVISCVVVVVYAAFCLFQSREYRIFFFIQIIYVISCMLDVNWFYFGIEKFKLTVGRSTIIKILNFIAIFVFVHEQSDLWKYCVIMAGSALLSQMVMWKYIPKYVHFVKPEFNEVIKHAKPMFILFIPVVAVSLYNVMDKIMVGGLSTKTELGYYENSEKIINCVKTVVTSFGTVMLPRMSRLAAEKDEKKSRHYMSMSVDAVMCTAFALAFGIACVAELFAPVYWGAEFEPCGILLIGLSISIPFSAMANFIRTQYMIPNGMDNAYTIAVIFGALINLIVNFILIPQYGAMGAVIATVFAEGLVCIIQCISVWKRVPMGLYILKSVPYLIIGAVMYIAVAFIGSLHLELSNILLLFVEIIIGAVIYMVLTFAYFVFTKNDLLNSIPLIRKK